MDLFRCLYQVIPYDEVGAEIALDLWWAKIFICLCGTLRSWGHLSFLYYMVKTGPMLRIFGSKIISLTFLDILNANLSEIETLKPHL